MLAVAGIRQASPWQPPGETPAVSACCHSSGTEYGHSPEPGPIGGRIPSSTTSLICGRSHSKVPSDHLCSVCVRVCVRVCCTQIYTYSYILVCMSVHIYMHVQFCVCLLVQMKLLTPINAPHELVVIFNHTRLLDRLDSSSSCLGSP